MIDFDAIEQRLTEAYERYAVSAPTVAKYCDDLIDRIQSTPEGVMLPELLFVQYLVDKDSGVWKSPASAANNLHNLMHWLGKDTFKGDHVMTKNTKIKLNDVVNYENGCITVIGDVPDDASVYSGEYELIDSVVGYIYSNAIVMIDGMYYLSMIDIEVD